MSFLRKALISKVKKRSKGLIDVSIVCNRMGGGEFIYEAIIPK